MAEVAYISPYPRAEQSVLDAEPDGPLFFASQLLQLASDQRARLAFAPAALIYRAAGKIATCRPSLSESEELDEAIARFQDSSTTMDEYEAQGLLRIASDIGPEFPRLEDGEADVRDAAWPEEVPQPPLRKTRCFSASAAAIIGEASCLRLLHEGDAAALLLERLEFVDEAMDKYNGLAEEGADEMDEEPQAELVLLDDDSGCGGMGEGPRALSAFWLELCGGYKGEHGRARVDELIRSAEHLSRAPPAPELVWRAMGKSCEQRPQISDEEGIAAMGEAGDGDEVVRDGKAEGLPHEWPVDGVISLSAVSEMTNPEALLDAAVRCMWHRRPLDALACLRQLEEVAGPIFWQPTHGQVAMHDQLAPDRLRMASALSARAGWLSGGRVLLDEATAAYMASAQLLETEWRSDPLYPEALQLWLLVSKRLCDMALGVGDVKAAAEYLSGVCEACDEEFFPPETMPTSGGGPNALLRWNALKRRQERLVEPEFKAVGKMASHLLLQRARMLLSIGAIEPRSPFNDECLRDLVACAKLCPPSQKNPLGDVARELSIGMQTRREEYTEAVESATALLAAQKAKKEAGLEAETLTALHATRTAHLQSMNGHHLKAVELYESVLANPKRVGALVWLRHAQSSFELGKRNRRIALTSFNEAAKIAKRHGGSGIAEGSEDGSTTDDAESRVSSAGRNRSSAPPATDNPMDELGLSMEQLWVSRYSLALLLQQDGTTSQAMGHFDFLLSDTFEAMPGSQYRIAALTGMASCLSQLGRQADALEAAEAAVKLGAGGEVLFGKALLHAQVGKMDESIATLHKLLQTLPSHQRALLALSSMLAYNGQLPKALGQASAAREMAGDDHERALATQQVGLLRVRMGAEDGNMEGMLLGRKALDAAMAIHGTTPPPVAADGFVALALAMSHMDGTGTDALANALAELKKGQMADQASALPLYYRGRLLKKGPVQRDDLENVAAAANADGAASESSQIAVDGGPITDEAASCFLSAATAFARKLPEAADECADPALKSLLFPIPTASNRPGSSRRKSMAARPGSARPSSAASSSRSSDDDGPSVPPPTLSAVLMYVTKREEALYLVDCMHSLGVHAHQGGSFAKAATYYDFAQRLAERVANASKGGGGLILARADAAAAWATLNRARLVWSSGGDASAAVADMDAAAKGFERAIAKLTTPASVLAAAQAAQSDIAAGAMSAADIPSLEQHVRKGAVSALFNLGAAQEASVMQQTIEARRLAAKDAREAGGRDAPRRSVVRRGDSIQGLEVIKASRDAASCFMSALSYDQMHGAAHIGLASLLLRKHKPREALSHLNHHALSQLPAAAINRGVVLQDLDDSHEGLEAARRETAKALEQLGSGSVVASFNEAQIRMLMGEWCRPLAQLQKLSSLPIKRIESPASGVDGTPEADRAWINAQLEPLLLACRKWQAVLTIAVNDFRTCASLLQPQLAFGEHATDEIFVPPPTLAAPADERAAVVEHTGGPPAASGPPLTPAQLTLLESLIDGASKHEAAASTQSREVASPPPRDSPSPSHDSPPNLSQRSSKKDGDGAAPTAQRGGRRNTREQLPDYGPETNAPATQLPTNVSASSLKRVLAAQSDLQFQSAERLLDSALRQLLPPVSRPLGAVGALLYTWRARSRLLVGKKVEAEEDFRAALAHVGAENADRPSPSVAEWLVSADEETTAKSTAAAVGELTKLRRAAAAAVEVVETAEAKLTEAREAADLVRGTSAHEGAKAMEAMAEAALAGAEEALGAFSGKEVENAEVIVAAAAAVTVPHAAWWACGLLLEIGRAFEVSGEMAEARTHYTAAAAWQRHNIIASANAARLLESVDNDLIGAAGCYIQIIDSTSEARRHAADATHATLDEDDDEDEVFEMREAAKCARAIHDELITQRQILSTGFAQRPADAGPPSEVPVAKQQGGIALAMDKERHRQGLATERALGMEASAAAANEVRRQRVAEATRLGGSLLSALSANPKRLFDTADGDLTFMLWGVEKSTVRLQAAMSRSAKVTDKKSGDDEANEERGSSAPTASSRIGSAPPTALRPEKIPKELFDRLMHWGDDGSIPDVELNVPMTERFINDVKNRRSDDG